MTTYNSEAADQYMRSVLTEELSIDESDNALTALTALTTAYPQLYPFDRTFVRPDHDRTADRPGPAGVRFIVYGEAGVERFIRLPRSVLSSLKGTIDELFDVLRSLVRLVA